MATAAERITTRKLFNDDRNSYKMLDEYVKEGQREGYFPESFDFPLALQFELTARCNLRCKHCYNASGEASSLTTMTPEDWLELSRHIVKHGGLFQCILSGGEPLLLGDKLFPIMDTLHEDGTSFILITNGLLMNKDWVRKFKKYRFYWFQISIDGHDASLHDEFRGVKGSFEKAVRGVFDMSNAGMYVRVAHTVSKTTLDSIDQMADLAYKIGASSIIIGEPIESGRSVSNKDSVALTQEERNRMYRTIDRLSKEYENRMKIYRSSFLKNQMLYYQILPNSVAIIRPDGNVRLDCLAPFVMGNVRERPFADIWREKSAACWQNEKVIEYIDSIQGDRSHNCYLQNYVDEDIWI